jgi:Glycosyltransferase family 87
MVANSFCDLGTGQLNSYQGLGRLTDADLRVRANAPPVLTDPRFRFISLTAKRSFRVFVVAFVVICVAALSYFAALRPVDFPVYHYAARTMLSRSGPMYGPQSGIGWPQVYRYPPLFLVLFIPFALLPLRLAAILWAALKFAVLALLVRGLFSRLRIYGHGFQFLSLLPALPYLAVEFHYGNAQFFIFALVAAAFLLLERRPILAAFALALAISIKVWPLFFVPYLLARKRAAVAVLAVALTVILTLFPAGYFGWRTNASLLHQWADQELGVASTAGEPGLVGFPSQSLHSVLMRFFASLNYAELTDSNYPKLNLGNFDPRVVEVLWLLLALAGYSGLLLLARRAKSNDLTVHGVAFCALLLLQPFTQIGDLVILLWPIAVAVAALRDDGDLSAWTRAALYTALSLMVLKPLIPDRNAQRLLQVLGVDFIATSLLAAGLIEKCLGNPKKAITARQEEELVTSLHIGSPGASGSRSA